MTEHSNTIDTMKKTRTILLTLIAPMLALPVPYGPILAGLCIIGAVVLEFVKTDLQKPSS